MTHQEQVQQETPVVGCLVLRNGRCSRVTKLTVVNVFRLSIARHC